MIAFKIVSIGIVASFVACARVAGAPPAAATAAPCALPIRVVLEASERLNPSERGDALPTIVRVYQLRQAARMEASGFSELWQTPGQALADDLLGVQLFTLFPGQTAQVEVELSPDTRFLSGVAIFRQPSGTQWRAILPLPGSRSLCAQYAARALPSPAITFRFDEYTVESHSHLPSERGGRALPADVAPRRASSTNGAP